MSKSKRSFHGQRHVERVDWSTLQPFIDIESLRMRRSLDPALFEQGLPYALYVNEQLAGFLVIDKTTVSGVRQALAIYVVSACRRWGHGRYLLDTLKIRKVSIHSKDRYLLGFYRSMGFRPPPVLPDERWTEMRRHAA